MLWFVIFAIPLVIQWLDLPLWVLNIDIVITSILCSISFFFCKDEIRRWMEDGYSKEQRLKWSKIMGCLLFIPVAIWPLGELIYLCITFDHDFILMAQIVTFPIVLCFSLALPHLNLCSPSKRGTHRMQIELRVMFIKQIYYRKKNEVGHLGFSYVGLIFLLMFTRCAKMAGPTGG